MNQLDRKTLAGMIDHTNLKAFATEEDFRKLCAEAVEYGFAMVAINESPVAFCKSLLTGTPVHVGAAIAFPLGQTDIACKVSETGLAIRAGADEIDYVLNVGKLKEGNDDYIREEMRQIVGLCRQHGVICKVIFENCYLTKDEIRRAALIAREIRPDYIKTSTGFGTGGAAVEDVRLMKETVGDLVKVKAAGGIRSWESARAMIEAGAERIGTSSGITIVREFPEAEGLLRERKETEE
ncbi:MAG: deoxyribose-phosphate aldolase [Lachnospiraceae bacterium]|nr:deoxyribose-phosphate aldolase [Lachnospiraceae bacterium]